MNELESMLVERGNRYGVFKEHARITQNMKIEAYRLLKARGIDLAPDQAEALDMIFHKIGRILNGDPDYADSWDDIAGYAKLVGDRLKGTAK